MLLLPSVDDSMREQIGSGDSDTDSEDYVDTSDMVPTTTQYVSYLLIASITPHYALHLFKELYILQEWKILQRNPS